MEYFICKHGNRITVKRDDLDHDFGEIINHRATLKDAMLCAKVERLVLRHVKKTAPQQAGEGSDK